jgi:hypothetical protein
VDGTLSVLANHDLVESHEREPCKRDLEPNFEPKSSKDQQKSKCREDANRNIHKLVKPSNFHGKDNTTLEGVMSFLEALKDLFGEDYKEAKQVRIAIVMLWGKAKVWWGQMKANCKARNQQPMNTCT